MNTDSTTAPVDLGAPNPSPTKGINSMAQHDDNRHPVCSHVGRSCDPTDPNCCQPVDAWPLPESADPDWVSDWDDDEKMVWSTPFNGLDVRVVAHQRSDGSIPLRPKVNVSDDCSLTPTEARKVAVALLNAADLADRWDDRWGSR